MSAQLIHLPCPAIVRVKRVGAGNTVLGVASHRWGVPRSHRPTSWSAGLGATAGKPAAPPRLRCAAPILDTSVSRRLPAALCDRPSSLRVPALALCCPALPAAAAPSVQSELSSSLALRRSRLARRACSPSARCASSLHEGVTRTCWIKAERSSVPAVSVCSNVRLQSQYAASQLGLVIETCSR